MMHDSLIHKFPFVRIVATLDESSCLLLIMLLVEIVCVEPLLLSKIHPYPSLAVLLTIDVYMMRHVTTSVLIVGQQYNAG